MTSVRCTDAWEWTLLLGLKLRRELTELLCCISDSALFNDILYIRKTHTVRYPAAVLEPFCSYDFITLPHWHSLETFRWQTIAWWFHSNELVNSTWLLKNYSNTVILSVWNAGKFLACCFGKGNQALSFLQEYWCLKTVWYISVYSKLRCMFWLMSSFSFYSNIPAPLKCSAQIKTWKTPWHSYCPGYLKLCGFHDFWLMKKVVNALHQKSKGRCWKMQCELCGIESAGCERPHVWVPGKTLKFSIRIDSNFETRCECLSFFIPPSLHAMTLLHELYAVFQWIRNLFRN